ncbi:MAG: hypothetical protein K6G75_09720 [Lachnospiraceae bacterium]|nr:hypothetical protein [Lachnospiraceae bacterium]
MKKIIYALLSLTLLISLFACAAPNKEPETLEEFYNQPLNKFMVDNMVKSAVESDDTFKSCDITFEGNKMIYSFYSNEKLEKDKNTEKYMQKYLESQKSKFFKELRDSIDIKDAVYEIEYIYYSNDYSKAFDISVTEDTGDDDFLITTDTQSETTQVEEKVVTLQSYYDEVYGVDYWKDATKLLLEQNSDIVSEINVDCVDNTVTYNFMLINDMGDIQDKLESAMDEYEVNAIINEIKGPTGVTEEITVIYIYNNPDGSIAAHLEFKG